jgi:hypothetical protein
VSVVMNMEHRWKDKDRKNKSTEWQSCLSASFSTSNPARTGQGLKEWFLPEPWHGTVLCVLASKVIAHLLTELLTHILTPWNKILFDKLTIFQLVKKISLILFNSQVHYHIHSARRLPQSWARSIQSTAPHSTSRLLYSLLENFDFFWPKLAM